MRIELRPMTQPADGVCIGTLDGHPMIVRDREIYVGDRHYEQAEVADAYVDAVDRAASAVLGSDWVTPLARLMQINKRSTAKDRIARGGLPEYILIFLGEASNSEHPRALGHFLLGVEAIQSAHGVTVEIAPTTGRPTRIDLVERGRLVHDIMSTASGMLDHVLAAREEFRGRRPLTPP